MKKKVLPLVLTAAMALCAVPAMADDAVEVISTTQAVTVNGEKVDFEGFNIEGFNYFKLEDVAAAVDKNVTFDGKTFTIEEAPAEETTAPTEATEATEETPAETTAPAEATTAPTEAKPAEETAKATEAKPAEETAKATEATPAEETTAPTEATEATAETTEEAPAEEEVAVEEGTEETTDVEYSSIEVEGVEYFKLRDLADIIGFGVDYDAATSTVVITTEAE